MDAKNKLRDDDDGPAWITTFADLVTLLLVFFILLFTMSSVEIERFQVVMQSIQSSLGQAGTNNSVIPQPNQALMKVPLNDEIDPTPAKPIAKQTVAELEASAKAEKWQALAEQLKSTLADKGLANDVDVQTPVEGIIVIQIKGKALFESGSTTLNYQVDNVLDKLLLRFRQQYDFDINIQGHTDNLQVRSSRYESNWELSALRATTVLRYFINKGISPKRLTATGYGDSVPIDTNYTPEGRANNRRIEFVLKKQAQITN